MSKLAEIGTEKAYSKVKNITIIKIKLVGPLHRIALLELRSKLPSISS